MIKVFKFELGDELQCLITGFKGICAGRTQYLTGCNRYSLQQKKLDKNGKPADWHAFDEDFLKKVSNGINEKVIEKKRNGGVYHDELIARR